MVALLQMCYAVTIPQAERLYEVYLGELREEGLLP
jgi:hypothetical protein